MGLHKLGNPHRCKSTCVSLTDYYLTILHTWLVSLLASQINQCNIGGLNRHCIALIYRYHSRNQQVTHDIPLVLLGLQLKVIKP